MFWPFDRDGSVGLRLLDRMLEGSIDFLCQSYLLFRHYFVCESLGLVAFSPTVSPLSEILLDADLSLLWSICPLFLGIGSFDTDALGNWGCTVTFIALIHIDVIVTISGSLAEQFLLFFLFLFMSTFPSSAFLLFHGHVLIVNKFTIIVAGIGLAENRLLPCLLTCFK